MSPDGAITYVSPAVEAMRGFTQKEAMSQSIDQIHPPESQAVNLDYFDRLTKALENGKSPEEFHGELEYYCRTDLPSGPMFRLSLTLTKTVS